MTNARRSTRSPMAETASRARLCRNTSAFTSTLLAWGSSTYQRRLPVSSIASRTRNESIGIGACGR